MFRILRFKLFKIKKLFESIWPGSIDQYLTGYLTDWSQALWPVESTTLINIVPKLPIKHLWGKFISSVEFKCLQWNNAWEWYIGEFEQFSAFRIGTMLCS